MEQEKNYQNFEALNLFLEICKIPHASFQTQALKEWIIKKAREFGAEVHCDTAGNIQCYKGKPQLCLQGHIDMVYVGKEGFEVVPEFFQRENKTYLRARDSSLGADNGVAVACMLLALRDCKNLECLFTNDEEVGMVGANHIQLDLKAPLMLNCDSEEIDEVVYSCAGGYDLECQADFEALEIPKNCEFFRISTRGFRGGHSGVEIHKGIPNAILVIVEIAESLVENGALVVTLEGGEKRNSIPVNAHLEVAIPRENLQQCQEILQSLSAESFLVESVKAQSKYFKAGQLLQCLRDFKNGVLEAKEGMPILSSNLGILKQGLGEDGIQISFFIMGRGNEELKMQRQIQKQREQITSFGFEVSLRDCYAPWEREDSLLLEVVWELYQKHRKKPKLKSIHAGLECGILKQKYPKISFLSIGPTIQHPHSVSEELDVESFVCFDKILKETLKRFQAF